jgi:hypothetical protein
MRCGRGRGVERRLLPDTGTLVRTKKGFRFPTSDGFTRNARKVRAQARRLLVLFEAHTLILN